MVTAAAATAFRISGKAAGSTMRDRLQSLNEEVLRVGAGEYHMSLSAVEIDGQTGRFTIYSAGGLPIMRLRQGDRPRLVPCAGSLLGSDGFQLGLVDGKLSPGDRILIYTDGIPELMLATGRMLGMRRFSMICENTVGLDLAAATQHLVTTADSLRGGSEQDDDWTLAFVEWTLPRSALTPRSDV
jgi:serine phosphatase RsbU (regulator of sigma subunit)